MKNLRILIADDHDLMRRGVRTLLEAHAGWEICAEAPTGREAVAKAEELKPRHRDPGHQHAGPQRSRSRPEDSQRVPQY